MTASRPAVSVIVPTYNCGRFIAEALESILRQTRRPDQIAVVDDGSTDDTDQVVSQFSGIEYIRQRNAGVSAARNTGLAAARGQFVTFLDADDRWRPKFVERMHELLNADPTAVCAFANFVRFENSTGQLLRDQFQCYPELRRAGPQSLSKDISFRRLVACGEFPAYTQVMMFRRDLVEPLRFDTSLALCEDANFALKAFMRGAVVYTDEVLAEIRRHDSNASRDVGSMAIHKLNALQALQPYVTGQNVDAYHDRLIKAHIDAALYRVRSGLQDFRACLRVPGSPMRKLKGAVRIALALI